MSNKESSATWLSESPQILECPKHLDHATAQTFEEDALLCVESGARNLICDAEFTDYLTAAGLRSILRIGRALDQVGGRLSVHNLKGQPDAVFSQVGFDTLFGEDAELRSLTRDLLG